jgi:hypothetical protein
MSVFILFSIAGTSGMRRIVLTPLSLSKYGEERKDPGRTVDRVDKMGEQKRSPARCRCHPDCSHASPGRTAHYICRSHANPLPVGEGEIKE